MHLKKYYSKQTKMKTHEEDLFGWTESWGLKTFIFFAFASILFTACSFLDPHAQNQLATRQQQFDQEDPFCVPQNGMVTDCDAFKFEQLEWKTEIPFEMHWTNFSSRPAYVEIKKVSTGDVLDARDITSDLLVKSSFSLINDIEELPLIVDVMLHEGSKCKHTYFLTCPEVFLEIQKQREIPFPTLFIAQKCNVSIQTAELVLAILFIATVMTFFIIFICSIMYCDDSAYDIENDTNDA